MLDRGAIEIVLDPVVKPIHVTENAVARIEVVPIIQVVLEGRIRRIRHQILEHLIRNRHVDVCPDRIRNCDVIVFIDNEEDENRFNSTKLSGLHRWFSYMGLGWYDQKDEFNCNPFERISRSLSKVFGRESKLECNDFMTALSRVCPELDGGEIFLQANQRYDRDAKQCTLGLSHALIELHSTKQLVLYCPKDSDGWSIASAGPTNDGKTLVGDRISHVELGKGFQHAK